MKFPASFLLTLVFAYCIFSQTISIDFKITWSEQTPAENTKLNCITSEKSYSISNIAFACGENGTVYMTSNGGLNWIFRGFNGLPSDINLTSISYLSNNIVLTTGNIGTTAYVYRSDNNGLNWVQVFSEVSGKINSILFVNPEITFLIGNPVNGRWSILRSPDKGVTWDSTGLFLPQNGNETGIENSANIEYFYNGQYLIWFATNNSRFYYSNNTGLNWETLTAPGQTIYSIASSGRYVICGASELYSSSDFGSVWSNEITSGTGIINGIIIPHVPLIGINGDNLITNTPIFYIRSDNKIYYTDNGGGPGWEVSYTATEGNFTYINFSFSKVLAVRDNGAITIGVIDVITSVSHPNQPYTFELKQNYPNPFNPKTKIPVIIYNNTNISLKIYNAEGKLVSTLPDSYFSKFNPLVSFIPGFHWYEFEWDGTDFPSGVYYYQVVSDDYKETRKMILLK